MKKTLLALSLFGMIQFSNAQGLEHIIVEKYYVANAADSVYGSNDNVTDTLSSKSVTYRVFVDMKPGYKFKTAYGSPTHNLNIHTSTSFFNSMDRGSTSPNGLPSKYVNVNLNVLDSWLSVGAAATGKVAVLKSNDTDGSLLLAKNGMCMNTDTTMGILLSKEDGMVSGSPGSISFVGTVTTTAANNVSMFDALNHGSNDFTLTNAAWSCLAGSVGADTTNTVLIGQFTTDGQFTFKLNVQLQSPNNKSELYVWGGTIAAGETQSNELIFDSNTLNTPTEVTNIAKPIHSFITVYPNPVLDNATLEIRNDAPSSKNQYVIYDVVGNVLASKQLQGGTGLIVEKIDLSSFASGIYFLSCTSDSKTSVTKLLKK